jgi:predicted RNase H-like HicB family nuclease
MKYSVIVEKSENGFGAYVPDLPGCVAAAETGEEVVTLIQEAIEIHIDGLKRSGDPVPSQNRKVTLWTYMPPNKRSTGRRAYLSRGLQPQPARQTLAPVS